MGKCVRKEMTTWVRALWGHVRGKKTDCFRSKFGTLNCDVMETVCVHIRTQHIKIWKVLFWLYHGLTNQLYETAQNISREYYFLFPYEYGETGTSTFLTKLLNFFFRHDVQTVYDAHPTFPPVKLSSVKVKNAWFCTSTPTYAFMAQCLGRKMVLPY
jgi:hypothetical protein